MVHYFDNAATTAMKQSALDAMIPLLTQTYGNPSGAHKMARDANRVLDDAREMLSNVIGCKPGDIVFTGGGTEADNLAIKGIVDLQGGLAVCSAIEHHAVLHPVEALGGKIAPVTPSGVVDLEALASLVDEEVSVVSVMAANNESGVIQPIGQIADVIAQKNPAAVFHCDAVQALCWLDIKEHCAKADLLTLSAHKFGGPKGVGALIVRDGHKIAPQLIGGSQERERRGGTQNVAGAIAMAVAAVETDAQRNEKVKQVARLRDRLVEGILSRVDNVVESGVTDGDRSHKTANICHLCFEGVESEALLFLLERKNIMGSAASSCASGAAEASHVLAAMGYSKSQAVGSLRLSLGYETTDADVDAVIDYLPIAVQQIRGANR